MILDVFREKVINKILNKKEDQFQKRFDFQSIKKVACLVDVDQFPGLDLITLIKKELQLPKAEICVLGYTAKQLSVESEGFPVFFQKEIGKLGKIKSTSVKDFVNAEYDVLINFFTENKFPLLVVSGSIKANVKVGFSEADPRCNDVLINCKPENEAMFLKEVKTYLKVITK